MPATITPASPTSSPLALSMTRQKSATFSIAVTLSDRVTPQDLTGATLFFYAQIGAVLISKASPSSGITVTSVSGGLATLQIEAVDTSQIPFGGVNSGPCELTMQVAGEDYNLASGTLIVYSNVGTP